MKATKALRPSETSLIIQAQIENLTPQQVLMRDELIRDGVPLAIAQEYISDIAGFLKKFSEWTQGLREQGAPEWFIKYVEERTPSAVAQVYVQEVTGQQ